ncbi:GAF domain-containing protein [Sphingomonas sp. BN140010]|uniref:histidine kinase n=1 Tax=Sphingomonas arvum TaxID=2992113 RepID=A0ABT3JGQ2_9SPHN|nr:ATP-binding protein [Sphingomonas sp. BN140010]MCW3797920.1 GAF domain-containing protein [Sphingomonas sp. BN140010]
MTQTALDSAPSGNGGSLDLTTCDREPIHIPGNIQPYGALLVLEPGTLRILQAANGTDAILRSAGSVVGATLADVLPPSVFAAVEQVEAATLAPGVTHLGTVRFAHDGGWRSYHAIAHRSAERIILEFEETVADEPGSFEDLYPHVREFLDSLQAVSSVQQLADMAAREVRRITGLDRALVYRFDEDWNGTVIAEDRNEALPSYLDLRFPASDIPAQARELYRLNRLRLIADANYVPVAIEPALDPSSRAPVNLSLSVLRSVSPVHLQYMRNMGTHASMSISLLRDGRLWGLISCHNAAPHRVPYHVRTACDFIGQILSLQLAAKEHASIAEQRHARRTISARLLGHMAAEDHFLDGLIKHGEDLLALTNAAGAAVVFGGTSALIGDTPEPAAVDRIISWLAEQRHDDDVFTTDNLAAAMPGAEALKDHASGLLAIAISQVHDSYVIWFRPEVIRTVSWGGDPRKRAEVEPDGLKLHPRTSFEVWKETVSLRSAPWHETEVEAATELRTAIVDIVLRRAEEMAGLSERLVAINKELEAFSYSVSHDLRAPFRHIVGYSQLLKNNEGPTLTERGHRYVDTIIESAISAGTLVDNLLSYSQMGRASMLPVSVDMNALTAEVIRKLDMEIGARTIEWKLGELAPARGDLTMIRLVLQNLISNAIKFTRDRNAAVIEIGCEPGQGENSYFVRDNGVGFDGAYVSKLFGVFQRLHRVEEFEGTGIGLANVRRIVERHGGRVWAEGQVDVGATISFVLPSGTE